MHDANRLVRGRFGRGPEVPGHDRCRRHIERGLSHGDKQLQGHRALGVVIVEPRTVVNGAVIRRVQRGVPTDVCVNLRRVVVVGAGCVRVRVHERSAE